MQLYSHDSILFSSLQIIDNMFFSVVFSCFRRGLYPTFISRKYLNSLPVSSTQHHLKAYIVFLIVSLLLVGTLAYLYTPFTISPPENLWSQSLLSSEVVVSAETMVQKVDNDSTSDKRIRLTNLLLRYQKERALLESQSPPHPSGTQAKIDSLRQKIENLESMITELSE